MIKTDIPTSLLQLPDTYVPPDIKTLDESNLPNIESFNPQQLEAYNELKAYINGERSYRAVVLEGYPGVGKTYVISQLIKEIILMNHYSIAMTAPTNKAVKVLRKMASYTHRLLTYKTIHSLLGLKEDVDSEGIISFIPDFAVENKIQFIKVLIIDEASMLPDELFEMVDECVEKYGTRIIYTGDPKQIPPVGRPDCIPFTPIKRTRAGIKQIQLTEIVRQKQGNPILQLGVTVRENITALQVPYDYKTTIVDEEGKNVGIAMINTAGDKEMLFTVCERYFTNIYFQKDADFMKVLAWTNKTVNWMNDKIRHLIFKDVLPEDFKKVMIGEKLIADKPIIDPLSTIRDRELIYNTNDEFEVVSYEVEEVKIGEKMSFKAYKTVTAGTNDSTKPVKKTIYIIHEDSEPQYNAIIKATKEVAKKETDSTTRKQKWKYHYRIANTFAQVKYAYAITVHKAQGSTYDNAIVIDKDIDYNKNVVERNRIRYVAYSRSRNLLFIVK